MFLGADWVGIAGVPPRLLFQTGSVGGATRVPTWEDYDVVVLQQPAGRQWRRMIRLLQDAGAKVVYEIDDYVHGIRRVPDHEYRSGFQRRDLDDMEMCMAACDAMIVSTPYLAHRYRNMSKRIFVCRNGLDLGRYRLTLPERPMVRIGWAGATGHDAAIGPWLLAVRDVMVTHPDTAFVSVGHDYALPFMREFGMARALSVPFTLIDGYPAAMTNIDIAIAPAGEGSWARGKSDLRWLEASALGIPVVADRCVYPDILPGVTGFWASSRADVGDHLVELVENPVLRRETGAAAQRYVREHRGIGSAAAAWREALHSLVD